MTWLTWRQFRAQAIAAAATLAALAIVLAVTGPYMAQLYDMSGIATCAGQSCQPLTVTFSNQLPWYDTVLKRIAGNWQRHARFPLRAFSRCAESAKR